MCFGFRSSGFPAALAAAAALLGCSCRAAVPTAEMLGGLPLFFEPRIMETEGTEHFLARGLTYQILIGSSEVEFAFHTVDRAATVPRLGRNRIPSVSSVQTRFARLKFVGSLAPHPQGLGCMEGKVNYLVGKEPASWRAHVPTYSTVKVPQLYPGIDLLYYGNQHQLEYDFTVAAGSDPKAIVMRFDGAHLMLNEQGDLLLRVGETEMRQHRPALYQMIQGARREVNGGYRLLDEQTIGFSVGPYDDRFPLIIDPIFSYSTFFGGPGGETGLSVKVDAGGSVYIAGQTMSTQFPFPIPADAFQKVFGGGVVNGDAFIAKLDNTGSKLIYFTYLGGSADDTALDLALDSAGNAYVTGFTDSPDFPTRNALFGTIGGTAQPTLNIYPQDAFVAELNPNGSALVYSTYLGGSGNDVGSGIAVDPSGNTYVTGYSQSTNFPVKNAFQNALYGNANAFVAKIGPNGSNLVYSTYLGGNYLDQGEGIAADAAGFAYVTGYTASTNFPTWRAQSPVINNYSGAGGVFDAFVTRIAPDGLGILYSTFLGGTNNDYGYRITVDAAQNVYVTGASQSVDFPHRIIALNIGNDGTNALNYDSFITRIDSSGTRTYSILFGGTSDDEGWDVAVDSAGRAFVIGTTTSTNFPVINPFGLFRSFNSGSNDVVVTAISADGTAVPYSGYLGGEDYDFGYGIAVDGESSAYITGLTFSKGFPVTSNPFQATLPGPTGAFVCKIRLFQPGLTPAIAGSNLRLSWPVTAPDYVLQSASSLSAPANWIAVPQPPVLNGNVYTVTVGTTNEAGFFRLYHP